MTQHQIGIDLGGTKIEICVLGCGGREVLRQRVPTPHTYPEILRAIADLVHSAESTLGGTASVGLGIPGVISPATGLVKNANTRCLNGQSLNPDINALLNRSVRVENDANCLALSEATDGAGAGFDCVFGVILGTGCGGGIVVNGRLHAGPHRVSGEWGHTPLPWPTAAEYPGNACWCGKLGCLEAYLAGPSLARDFDGATTTSAMELPGRAIAGDERAAAALERHVDRLARGLAMIINILDPDVFVLGGGLSNLDHLYVDLPRLIPRYAFSDVIATPVLRAKHGDSSGVRGAAWLGSDQDH